MEGRSQPVDLEGLFAEWLARSGTEEELEALCRQHAQHAPALRELHADWQRLRSILSRAGLGISREHGDSFALRLKEQYGSGVDPAVALERGEEPAPSSQLLKRLAGHAPKGSRYQLRGELARGGMGAILKVWDEDLRRSLAMKVILGQGEAPSGHTPPVDRRQLARFLEEAQVTGQLDHPGIVPVHELGLDADGRVYFTMKLVKGRDLKTIFDHVFEEREGWNETRALGVLLKVCEAIAYAHAKGVIHRDLKPANVMVGDFGEVYVMDWGLARVLGREDKHDLRIQVEGTPLTSIKSERREEREESPDSPLFTMDGDVVGTPAYMSPEQARGEIERLSARSDVYAVGAMIYHLLARHMPYVPYGARVTNRSVLMMVLHGPPPALHTLRPDVPAELAAIAEKAMAREPERRYADTLELARDLRAFLEGRVVRAYEAGAWAEAKKWVARNKPLGASLAAAVLLLAGGLAASLTLGARAERNAALAANNAVRADEKAAEAERLRQEAVVREEAATARADALWAIEELRYFHTLDDDLEYARSQDRPTYVWWLEQAHELVDGRPADPARGLRRMPSLDDHQRLLQRIRTEARADRVGSGADREKDWWNTNLTELVEGLEELRERIAVAERSVVTPEARARWNEAIEAVAGSGKYGGLRLTRQLELLPLGPDPDSGLWEFAHLATGEAPIRASDGKLASKPETGMVFVLLPSGRVPVEDGHQPTPLNDVLLDPFFLSKYEMTVAQWQRKSLWTGSFSNTKPLVPAAGVSWADCVAVVARAGLFLRLPSNAQWEYGCRGGRTTKWWTGADSNSLRGAAHLAWERRGETINLLNTSIQPVGQLIASPFGLHDMIGNVSEWCQDAFIIADDGWMPPLHPGDGMTELEGLDERLGRVLCFRGGSFSTAAESAGPASRSYTSGDPEQRQFDCGLRVVRAVTP